MSTSAIKLEPVAVSVRFTSSDLIVELADGRRVSAPLRWFPRLSRASPRERKHYKLIGRGIGIHWPELDEDISVENLLLPRATMKRGPARRAR